MKSQRISREFLGELCRVLGLSPRRVQQIIEERTKEFGFVYDRKVVALELAATKRINVRKYATRDELEELQKLRQSIPFTHPPPSPKLSKRISEPTIIRLDKELEIRSSNIPSSVIADARTMTAVYPYLYVFENSLRYFIKDTLEPKYGDKWWELRVKPQIKQKVQERQNQEGGNRWHGKRGRHEISYTDIEDLRQIITSNLDDFRDKLPKVRQPVEWLANRMQEIELSRNIVAHNNPLSERDIARLKLYFRDWVEHLEGLKGSLPN